jgi:thiamine kinase
MTPAQWVAQLFNVDASTLLASRIKNGLTNESYQVTGLDHNFVVRLSNTETVSLRINRRSEAVVLKLVEHAGIGAPVLLNQTEARVLITREVAGRTLMSADVATEFNIARIAILLRELHTMTVPDSVQTMWLVATLKGYWRFLGLPENPQALRIAHESDQQSLRCLCHNDVHHLNLIDDGTRLWLLDWEYAAIGDPYFDLASVCCYHQFDQAQRHALLDCYARACSTERSDKVPLRQFSDNPTSDNAVHPELVEGSYSENRMLRQVQHERRSDDEWPHDHSLLIDHARLDRMCGLFDYIKELWFAARNVSGENGN